MRFKIDVNNYRKKTMNMKIYLNSALSFLALAFLININITAQGNFNLEEVAHVPINENLSDIWGYVDADGNEYALVGTRSKTEIYSLANPSNPELIHSVPGANSIWRDIKTLGHFAYVTTDQGTDGITIIDLSGAPDNITSSKVNPVVNGTPITTCHNLYIDTLTQYMFLAGCNSNDGVLAFDIVSDPLIPTLVKELSLPYAHDVFVRDGLVFASEIFGGDLAIYDAKDIQNPVLLGSSKTTNFFTHNAWSSEDNKYVFTTDEVSNGTIDAFDISDLTNPRRIDVFVPESIKGKGVVPHNTHWMNDYLITSWYTYGVVISDVSNPSKIIETGHFNTGAGPDCWGVYPYLPSGLIIASDIINGFYVLQPKYTRASFVKGLVTDEATGNPIFNAIITILAPKPFTSQSDPQGNYVAGQLEEGTFIINFNHPEYESKTLDVTLIQGEEVELNVALKKSDVFTQTILTIDKNTGEPLGDVDLLISKEGFDSAGKTDVNGSLVDTYVSGDFKILAGKWGYEYKEVEVSFVSDASNTIELERGYQDDFIFDYNWSTQTPNARSQWVRVEPIETTFSGQVSNPGSDVEGDYGTLCYVTGNGSGGAGAFDVDDGNSVLQTPNMTLANHQGATLEFSAWFFNNGGSGAAPNDTFKIFISNGDDIALITKITESIGDWKRMGPFKLADFITLNDNISITFEAADQENNGHLVEAGLDAFSIDLAGSVSVDYDQSFTKKWSLYPNPVQDKIFVSNDSFSGKVVLTIYSADGSLVSQTAQEGSEFTLTAPSKSGMYFMNIKSEKGQEEILHFIKL